MQRKLRLFRSVIGRRLFSATPDTSTRRKSPSFLLVSSVAVGAGVFYFRNALTQKLMDPVLMPLLRCLDPESAHMAAVQAAKYGLSPSDDVLDPPLLRSNVLGHQFTNPIGMAAGFDKHAEAMEGILDMGFGFVEIGSVTPEPQDGNPKPRVFRLTEDRGIINRYGFNSEGVDAVQKRLIEYSQNSSKKGVLGVNLGKNKLTKDAASDYIIGVKKLGPYADYLVINVSSPNTPGLRSLQGKVALKDLITRVLDARNQYAPKVPLLVKIAPDLTEDDKNDIAEVTLETKIDGLIVSNTTISRPSSLKSDHKTETGGLSGAPVKDMSTKVIFDMYKLTEGKVPLIGVGGVSSGEDAYDKIRAGASLVQMYSCMIYDGPNSVPRAKKELLTCLERDGFLSLEEAVGSAHKKE